MANACAVRYIDSVRPNAGNTARFTAVLAVWLLLVGGGADSAGAVEVVSRGDFTFYLDSAVFRGKGGRVLEEVYVRIPNNEVRFQEESGVFRSRVKLMVRITDVSGDPVVEDTQELLFSEASGDHARSPIFFQTVINRYFIEPGVYLLSYAIEDLEASKVTVVGAIRGKHNIATVRDLRVDLPEIPDNAPSFSLPMFAWSVDAANERARHHPNPPRMYGLYKDTLLVYVELYLPDSLASSPTFEFRSSIVDGNGETMADRKLSLPNPDPRDEGTDVRTYPVLIREDLTRFPAGAYSLHFSFGLANRVLSRMRAGAFSVAWDVRTWEVPRRDLLAEARFLLGDDEFTTFTAISAGEQEKTLDKLWEEADPTPGDGDNEVYEEFLRRLAYVNDRFGASSGEAIFSDRGKVYLKWGAPDEFVQDVIPVNRETISEAFEVIENKYHPMNYSSHGAKAYNQPARTNSFDTSGIGRVGEDGNEAYPFELWVYNGPGRAILKKHDIADPEIGMRFLFIDREGFGVYKLETSTTISDR